MTDHCAMVSIPPAFPPGWIGIKFAPEYLTLAPDNVSWRVVSMSTLLAVRHILQQEFHLASFVEAYALKHPDSLRRTHDLVLVLEGMTVIALDERIVRLSAAYVESLRFGPRFGVRTARHRLGAVGEEGYRGHYVGMNTGDGRSDVEVDDEQHS